MKSKGLLALVCAVALTAACNNNRTANREAGTAGTAGAGVSNSDKNFVSDQLSDGMAEIDLAKVARDHAASPDVKQFAQMMIDDHTKAGDELKRLRQAIRFRSIRQIDNKQQDLMDKLSKLNGADFDKEYMSAMVDDHQDAVRDLRSRVDENRSATDRLTGKNPENRRPSSPNSRTTG
jgi:putative membrane protein